MKVNLMELSHQLRSNQVMICFSGPFSHAIIEDLGKAVRQFMESANEPQAAVMDVFSVYIELSQNVRNYTGRVFGNDADAGQAIIVIGREGEHYVIGSGNVVARKDIDPLLERVEALRGMDATALRRLYKQTLRERPEPQPGEDAGAGLGLIEVARRASQPLDYAVHDLDDGRAFFSLQVVI